MSVDYIDGFDETMEEIVDEIPMKDLLSILMALTVEIHKFRLDIQEIASEARKDLEKYAIWLSGRKS